MRPVQVLVAHQLLQFAVLVFQLRAVEVQLREVGGGVSVARPVLLVRAPVLLIHLLALDRHCRTQLRLAPRRLRPCRETDALGESGRLHALDEGLRRLGRVFVVVHGTAFLLFASKQTTVGVGTISGCHVTIVLRLPRVNLQ